MTAIREWFLLALACLPVLLLHFKMPQQTALGAGKEYQVVSKPESTDLERIRTCILEQLLTSTVDEERVSELLQTIRDDGSWPGINYEDVSRTGFEHRVHVANLSDLSLAYAKPGSKYNKDPEVMKTILAAIDFWIANDFIADNWHTNEIGNPTQWGRILLLLDDDLPQEQSNSLVRLAGRANLEAWGARPGGDLIKIAGIMAELAVYQRDEEALKRAVQRMAGEVKVSKGRGIQPDLSFHHRDDRVTSTLSYGTSYAGAFADWAARLAGTQFAFPAESLELLIDFYLDGICQTMVHGWYKDPGAINRSMSRPGSLKPIGPEIPEKLLAASDYRRKELENVAAIRKGEKASDLTRTRFFWHSEYFSHQRPGYFVSVRMFSDRNRNMEFPHNEESLKHHHYADGSSFLSRTGTEYYDIFPVWDWQKIPGTTVVQKPSLPHWREIVKRGQTNFVGGLSDNHYGMAAFDFASPHDPLTARKAWFFFDEEYVCLGAGIESSSEYPVVTTINQSLFKPAPVVKTAGGASVVERGEQKVKSVEWVFHDETAYVFPQPATTTLHSELHQGRWSDITNHSARALEEEVENHLFTIWLDHGTGPQNASYEYVVKPAIALAGVESFARNLPVKILVNTPAVQAVRHDGLNITQVAFYEPGTLEIAEGIYLTVEDPGLVMVKVSGKEIDKITVSDPTRELRTYRLSVTARFQGEGYNWKALWYKSANYSTVDIELPVGDEAGMSAVLEGNVDAYSGATDRQLNRAGRRERSTDTPKPAGSHFIGEQYGGGVVVWMDETGEHGLIAATADQHDNAVWRKGRAKTPQHFGDHYDGVTGARADGIGAGQENTRLILAQPVEGVSSGAFAAQACSDCRLGEYDDWYLPSKAELRLIYEEKEKVGGLTPDLYWSSTEYNVGFAWMQSFGLYGNEYTSTKGTRGRVRCVRRF